MIFRKQFMSGNLSATLIVSAVFLVMGTMFSLFVLPIMLQAPTDLWIGDGIFRAEMAMNDKDRTKGLSGTPAISPDKALIMVFPSEDKWGIWMKEMNYPLDILWLDKDKRVIFIQPNVSSDDQTTVYKPNKPAKYVVELPGGAADAKAVHVNSIAIFQVNILEVK